MNMLVNIDKTSTKENNMTVWIAFTMRSEKIMKKKPTNHESVKFIDMNNSRDTVGTNLYTLKTSTL